MEKNQREQYLKAINLWEEYMTELFKMEHYREFDVACIGWNMQNGFCDFALNQTGLNLNLYSHQAFQRFVDGVGYSYYVCQTVKKSNNFPEAQSCVKLRFEIIKEIFLKLGVYEND